VPKSASEILNEATAMGLTHRLQHALHRRRHAQQPWPAMVPELPAVAGQLITVDEDIP
jgi:hypothetical protein